MTDIISPIQEDGLLLTPQQKQERLIQKVEAFKNGLAELEQKTGMTLQVSLIYTPKGIFPGGKIVPLTQKPAEQKPVSVDNENKNEKS